MNEWLQHTSVLALVGSPHSHSISKAAAECAISLLVEQGIRAETALISDFFSSGSDQSKSELLIQKVRNASALICASPEYGGTYAVLMKNGLRLLHQEDLYGKPVGCIGLGYGIAGGSRAMASLMEDMESLGANPLPYGIFISPNSIVMSYRGFETFSNAIFQQLRTLGNDVVFEALIERSAA
jgi:NAD(P)H-dependent FMN reductase